MKPAIEGILCCLLLAGWAAAQNYPPEDFPAQLPTKPQKTTNLPATSNPPPHSPDSEESSSKETKIDLSPPNGDAKAHPNSGGTETQAYNPHKALKNVEVGDFYFKKENYAAALDRYREALRWKPEDAEATFKLAWTFEKLGRFHDARANYDNYLKILPQGPRSKPAHKALERLPAEETAPNRSQVSSPEPDKNP